MEEIWKEYKTYKHKKDAKPYARLLKYQTRVMLK